MGLPRPSAESAKVRRAPRPGAGARRRRRRDRSVGEGVCDQGNGRASDEAAERLEGWAPAAEGRAEGEGIDRPRRSAEGRAMTWGRRVGLGLLLAWAGFWVWFDVAAAFGEAEGPGVDPRHLLMAAVLAAAAGLAWRRPIAGCPALVALAGFGLWPFGPRPFPPLTLLAPPVVAAGLLLAATLGRRAPAGGRSSRCSTRRRDRRDPDDRRPPRSGVADMGIPATSALTRRRRPARRCPRPRPAARRRRSGRPRAWRAGRTSARPGRPARRRAPR
jgi:hypothetical protein